MLIPGETKESMDVPNSLHPAVPNQASPLMPWTGRLWRIS